MTQYETLSLVFGGIQAIAIVISFAALWWQLRQFNENMKYDAYAKHVEDYSKVSEYLLQHPDLNGIYFSKQPEVAKLSNEEKDFYNFVALIVGYYERLYVLRHEKKWIDQSVWRTWETWLVVQWFPIHLFEIYWRHEKEWYNPGFVEYVDARYAEYVASKSHSSSVQQPC